LIACGAATQSQRSWSASDTAETQLMTETKWRQRPKRFLSFRVFATARVSRGRKMWHDVSKGKSKTSRYVEIG